MSVLDRPYHRAIPISSAPAGSLLLAIELAQRSTSGMGGGSATHGLQQKRACLAAAETHRELLAGTIIGRERCQYCHAGGNPWPVLWEWVAAAMQTQEKP